MAKYKINKEKCVGCQACVQICPEAIKIGPDGKAEIIDQEKLEKCGGESICQLGAIEEVSERK
jgi:ferredoxin